MSIFVQTRSSDRAYRISSLFYLFTTLKPILHAYYFITYFYPYTTIFNLFIRPMLIYYWRFQPMGSSRKLDFGRTSEVKEQVNKQDFVKARRQDGNRCSQTLMESFQYLQSWKTPVLTYVMALHPVDAKHHPYCTKAAQRGKGKPSSITKLIDSFIHSLAILNQSKWM